MKKRIALLLALVMAFSLVACAAEKKGGGSGKKQSGSSWWEDLPKDDDDNDQDDHNDNQDNDDQDGDSNISAPSDDDVPALITVGTHKLSATDFAYFYYDAIAIYKQNVYEQYYPAYGDYWSMMLDFDPELPLDEQIYHTASGETWQDYFKDAALSDLHLVYALYDEAVANEYTLSPEKQDKLDNHFSDLSLYAAYFGYDDEDAYLSGIYGEGATLDSYTNYYYICTLSASYRDYYSESLTFTQAELDAYAQTDVYYSTLPNVNLVNVRHILALFEGYTDEDRYQALTKAEQWLQEWKDGSATEESFAELANQVSEDRDGNVTNGGLYEDIYPGQMVANFENWCFDLNHKPGDTGIVETEYGYHVMYFSSYSDVTYIDLVVESDMRLEYTENWENTLVENTALTVGDLSDLDL